MKLKSFILIIIAYFPMHLYGQLMMDDINFGQIQHKKIRKYVEHQINQGKQYFYELRPSWRDGEDLSSFSKKEMTFVLEGNLQDVWQGYISADPSESWSGRRISFDLLIQKSPTNIYYNEEPTVRIDTGQIYFLNLKLMHGICNIPVAFEIINVDTDKKIIEFSYIEGNKSLGVQQIKFKDVDGDHIKIKHTSYFKSDSQSRDKYLYPFFHKKLVKDFHRNMKKLIALGQH